MRFFKSSKGSIKQKRLGTTAITDLCVYTLTQNISTVAIYNTYSAGIDIVGINMYAVVLEFCDPCRKSKRVTFSKLESYVLYTYTYNIYAQYKV